MANSFYIKWLYLDPGGSLGLTVDDNLRINRRDIAMSTLHQHEGQDVVRRKSAWSFVQVLTRRDGKCDVLWPRKKMSDGKWVTYEDLDTVKIAMALRGMKV